MSGAPERQDNELPSGVVREALAALSVAVSRARQALLWESVWPVLAALLCAAGIFLSLSWAGLWISLPPYGRIIGVALFALLLIAVLVPAIRIRIPGLNDAVSRLDRSNIAACRHAPFAIVGTPGRHGEVFHSLGWVPGGVRSFA